MKEDIEAPHRESCGGFNKYHQRDTETAVLLEEMEDSRSLRATETGKERYFFTKRQFH